MPRNNTPSLRSLKVQENLKRVISTALSSNQVMFNVIGDISLLVTEVRMSSDLKSAFIYVYPQTKEDVKDIIDLLNEFSWQLNSYIGKATNLKYTPKLNFVYDDSFDKAERIEEVIKTSKKKDD